MPPPLHIHLIDSLNLGGAQTHLLTMLTHATTHYPYRHRVMGLFGPGPMAAEFERIGVPVDVADLGPSIRKRNFFRAIHMVEKPLREHQPSVVEAHLSYSRFFGIPAAARARVPVRVGFEHGDLYLSGLKYRLAHYLVQRAAQRIVVCSHVLETWARATQGLQRHRTVVMHNCVNPELFLPAEHPALDHHGFAPSTTVLCAVGTLGTGVDKRVDIIIRAVAESRSRGADVALVVCGDGEQRPALERLIAELCLESRVVMLGFRRDVARILSASDIFCHAAPFEPFGIVCIEAMAMQLPVIVPASGGVAEIVEAGVTGLLYTPLDVEALAAAIRTLHDNASLRKTMGERGRQTVLEKYTVGRYMENLYALYDQLAERN